MWPLAWVGGEERRRESEWALLRTSGSMSRRRLPTQAKGVPPSPRRSNEKRRSLRRCLALGTPSCGDCLWIHFSISELRANLPNVLGQKRRFPKTMQSIENTSRKVALAAWIASRSSTLLPTSVRSAVLLAAEVGRITQRVRTEGLVCSSKAEAERRLRSCVDPRNS